jgi:hypothetical protein
MQHRWRADHHQRGFRKSTLSRALTGLGGDLFIIDDPQKPRTQSEARRNSLNQWVPTLMSRLDNKETGAVIVVMQRVRMDDLSGFLSSSSDDWEVLSLPAIAEVDERIAIDIGEFYQRSAGEALHPAHESLATCVNCNKPSGQTCSPPSINSPRSSRLAMIKRPGLRYYDVAPECRLGRVIQSWIRPPKTAHRMTGRSARPGFWSISIFIYSI